MECGGVSPQSSFLIAVPPRSLSPGTPGGPDPQRPTRAMGWGRSHVAARFSALVPSCLDQIYKRLPLPPHHLPAGTFPPHGDSGPRFLSSDGMAQTPSKAAEFSASKAHLLLKVQKVQKGHITCPHCTGELVTWPHLPARGAGKCNPARPAPSQPHVCWYTKGGTHKAQLVK